MNTLKRLAALGLLMLACVLPAAAFDNAGVKNLGDYSLTTAETNRVITSASDVNGATQAYVDRLQGMSAATLSVNFTYGSGGTTLKVMIETTPDFGTTWIEVARIAFTTSSGQRIVNLSGLTPKTTVYTPASLSDDTAVDGILGDRWRAKITSTGTYAGNTAVSVRLVAR